MDMGERNKSGEQGLGGYGLAERNAEGYMVLDFAKRIAVFNIYFKKREEPRVMYKRGRRWTDGGLHLMQKMKSERDAKVVTGAYAAGQHR